MKISINPSYHCNLRCNFCYYFDWLDDASSLKLSQLEQKLDMISSYEDITWIDLYGGELSLLDNNYITELLNIIRKYYKGTISAITNFVKPQMFVNGSLSGTGIRTAVSYDFDCRSSSEKVWSNIVSYDKDLHVLMVATPCLVSKNVDDMIIQLNSCSNIKSVDIKNYSSSLHNELTITWHDYEEFLIKWVSSEIPKNFECKVEYNLRDCISGTRYAWNDNHVFIRPNGDLAILDFDEKQREYFVKLNDWSDFHEYVTRERSMVENNPYCGKCPWIGKCLTEQYRNVTEINNGCNGFRNLIEWYTNYVPRIQ